VEEGGEGRSSCATLHVGCPKVDLCTYSQVAKARLIPAVGDTITILDYTLHRLHSKRSRTVMSDQSLIGVCLIPFWFHLAVCY
jgi:hypothetical protein